MKHPLLITALLVFLFVAAQVIGLALLSLNIKDVTTENGVTTVVHGTTAIGDRPQTSGAGSLIYLLIGVGIGTALVLLIIRFKALNIWKVWFLLAVWLSTTIALGVIMPSLLAILICLVFAVWKVYWPNPIVHNLTEVFMYAGLAVLLSPIFTLLWAIILLLIISVYDIWAVWHSKHMVVMAEAQTESQVFAGLYIPKTETDGKEKKTDGHKEKGGERMMSAKDVERSSAQPAAQKTAPRTARPISDTAHQKDIPGKATKPSSGAILGGGDIAFPLLFSGVVMDWLIVRGVGRAMALYETLIVTACATAALSFLFWIAKKDRFYPAMPFITAGCLVGLMIVWIL